MSGFFCNIFNLLFGTKVKPLKSLAAAKFPDLRIPLIMMILAVAAIIFTKESDFVLRILVTVFLILSGLNILRQTNLNLFQKITVYSSILFYLLFINFKQFGEISKSFGIITFGVAGIGLLSFILSFIFRKLGNQQTASADV